VSRDRRSAGGLRSPGCPLLAERGRSLLIVRQGLRLLRALAACGRLTTSDCLRCGVLRRSRAIPPDTPGPPLPLRSQAMRWRVEPGGNARRAGDANEHRLRCKECASRPIVTSVSSTQVGVRQPSHRDVGVVYPGRMTRRYRETMLRSHARCWIQRPPIFLSGAIICTVRIPTPTG
jgi:hypothetical protein